MAAPAIWERMARHPAFQEGSAQAGLQELDSGLILDIDPRRTRLYWPQRDALDPNFVDSLVGFVDRADAVVAANLQLISGRSGDSIFRTVYGKDTVAGQKEKYYDTLERLAKIPEVQFALPKMGAFSIGAGLLKRGVSADRLHLVAIGGTLGATTGGARIEGELPQVLKTKSNIKIFADDVGDSGNTLVSFLNEVSEKGNYDENIVYSHIQSIQRRIKELRDSKVPYNERDYGQIYREVASYLRSKNVIYAPLYIKNPVLKKAIVEQVELSSQTSWAQAQRIALQYMIPIDEHLWIIGGRDGDKYGFLDSGMEGERLLDTMRNFDPKTAYQLGEQGFKPMKLRMGGGIDSLIALYPQNEPAYVNLAGHLLAEYMQSRGSQAR